MGYISVSVWLWDDFWIPCNNLETIIKQLYMHLLTSHNLSAEIIFFSYIQFRIYNTSNIFEGFYILSRLAIISLPIAAKLPKWKAIVVNVYLFGSLMSIRIKTIKFYKPSIWSAILTTIKLLLSPNIQQ